MKVTIVKAPIPPRVLAQQRMVLPCEIFLADRCSGAELMRQLQMNPEIPAILVVNDKVAPLPELLHENDRIEIIYSIGGG
jgi:sulfur carrier protein ThiS